MIAGFWLTVKCQFNSDTDCWYVALGVLAIWTDHCVGDSLPGKLSSEGHRPWREGEEDTAMGERDTAIRGWGDTAVRGGPSPWREGEGDTAMGGEGHSHQGKGGHSCQRGTQPSGEGAQLGEGCVSGSSRHERESERKVLPHSPVEASEAHPGMLAPVHQGLGPPMTSDCK